MRLLTLLPLGMVLGAAGATPSGPPTLTVQPSLSVVGRPGMARVAPDDGRFDAGTVDPNRTPRVERTFVLRNDTGRPVVIAALRGSCGCETLLLRQGETTVRRATLPAGGLAEVRMAVDMRGQRAGRQRKLAWVLGPDGLSPLAILEIALTVRPAVAFTPPSLAFGPTQRGETRALPLTAAVDADALGVDADALGGAALPPLVSDDPRFRVTPRGRPRRITRDGRPAWAQSYRVALSLGPRAPTGALGGTLHFRASRAAVSAVAAAVSAEAVGPVAAAPSPLSFGSVVSDRDRTRSVVLFADSAPPLQALTVTSDSRSLIPRLQPPPAPAGAGPSRRILDVTLRAGAPAGALRARVVLSAPDGARLALTVLADVLPPPPSPARTP